MRPAFRGITDVQPALAGIGWRMSQAEGASSNQTGKSARIARQVVLPFGKSLEISIKSIKVRFFRSMITVASLVLAVAFLSFILTGANVAAGLVRSGEPQLRLALVEAGYDLPSLPPPGVAPDVEAGKLSASPKERWIVILSLLVCTVGIVNAQLMAVTERFREIGTMKCLGALDRFILRLFLLEAGMQGLVGAFIGAILGVLVGLLVGLVRFGLAAAANLSALDVLATLGISVAVGAGLSLLGVVYPAAVAARMRPIEAMRAQE
jgi:cell division protein FtsX